MALPMHEKYKDMFSAVTGTAQKIGQSLGPRRSPKAVDTGQYDGLAGAVRKNLPITPKSLGTITTPYMGSTRFEAKHPGIDYSKGMGSPVQSWTGGKVSEVVTGKVKGSPAFGNFIKIIDNRGNMHRYSHLQGGYTPFSVGQTVQRGDIIGREGATGQVYSLSGGSGAHTDWRIKSQSGAPLDPMQFVQVYQQLMK